MIAGFSSCQRDLSQYDQEESQSTRTKSGSRLDDNNSLRVGELLQ